MKRSSIAFFIALAFSNTAFARSATPTELPTGGKVVVGSGSISQSGDVLTVNQNTGKLAINWTSFNIGANGTVNFVQPSADAIALNRVVGSDVSVIQGKLNANGNVFLINPNGILFTPTAQVNVGGLLASTLNISNKNFENFNFTFSGNSSNAIINQGNITSTKFGVALIAAKITNEGTIVANNGGDVGLAAGSQVTLDLGGPVKLQVKKAAIDALILNGGAIKANGGMVYLTASAANKLATTVINNTGLIEAQTLATGEKGEIHLVGDMDNDGIIVGGKLDVSAPNGGDEGSITINAASVKYTDAGEITLSAMEEIAAAAERAANAAEAKAVAAEEAVAKAKSAVEKAEASAKARIAAAEKAAATAEANVAKTIATMKAKIAAAERAAKKADAAAEIATKNAEAKALAAKKDPTNTALAKQAKKALANAEAKQKVAKDKAAAVKKTSIIAEKKIANAEANAKNKAKAVVKTTAAAERSVAIAKKKAAPRIAKAEAKKAVAEESAAMAENNATAAKNKLASLTAKPEPAEEPAPAVKPELPTVPSEPIALAQKGDTNPSSAPTARGVKFQNLLDSAPTAAGGEEEATEQPASNELIINYIGDGINLPE